MEKIPATRGSLLQIQDVIPTTETAHHDSDAKTNIASSQSRNLARLCVHGPTLANLLQVKVGDIVWDAKLNLEIIQKSADVGQRAGSMLHVGALGLVPAHKCALV